MSTLPIAPTKSTLARNPHLWPAQAMADNILVTSGLGKPMLNKTETRWRDVLRWRGYDPVFEQAFTLRLDKPFASYRPDLAVLHNGKLVFFEVKAPHRFSRAGIAKASLAAKTYPQFQFVLAMWKDGQWEESVLSP